MNNRVKKAFKRQIRVVLFMLLCFSSTVILHAQNSRLPASLVAAEDTLKALGDSVLHGSGNEVRQQANEVFKNTLGRVLMQKESFEFAFDSAKTLGKETAPDKSFRIYSWIVPQFDGSGYEYHGFIQTYDREKEAVKVFSLTDSSRSIINPEALKLRNDNWYGALYYKILKHTKGSKSYYTVLGWHGKDQTTTQKVIDVIYFNGGKPMFGYPFFKMEKVYKSRIVFEYSKQAVMSLKYDEKKKLIVFDRLAPLSKEMENVPSMYVPNGSNDVLQFKGGHWNYIQDVDIRTNWEPKKQPKNPVPHEPPIQNGE